MPTLAAYRDPTELRFFKEPSKQNAGTDTDHRSEVERDYGRVLHCGAFRRLQGKSQVVHTGHADFFRTRLTHTLEVAQIARSLAERSGYRVPYLVETVALIHDLGHPPFGHNGEDALKAWMKDRGSFEANAQSFRIIANLEVKFRPRETSNRRAGLNLTRETLRASFKYPWPRQHTDAYRSRKFGFYAKEKEAPIARWAIGKSDDKHIAAKFVDLADDIAYSVHDLEDGVRQGMIPLHVLVSSKAARTRMLQKEGDRLAALGTPMETGVEEALDDLLSKSALFEWCDGPYRKEDDYRGAMKRMTSGLIDRFVSSIEVHTDPPQVAGDVEMPARQRAEVAALKAMTWTYLISSQQLQTLQYRERRLIKQLADALLDEEGWRLLTPDRREMMEAAEQDNERARIVCDFIAGMTDRFAQSFHARLFGTDAQFIGDAL